VDKHFIYIWTIHDPVSFNHSVWFVQNKLAASGVAREGAGAAGPARHLFGGDTLLIKN